MAANNGGRGAGAFVVTGVVPAAVESGADGGLTSSSGTTIDAGETIALTGGGYPPGSTVELIVYSTPTAVGSAMADGNGNFSAQVTLPKSLSNGTHHLVTEITVSGGVATASGLAYTGFTVLPFVGAGVLALGLGGGLLVASRRRQAA